MYLSSLVLLPSPDTTEVITIITQKRKGRSSIYKTIFHLHVCMTYFCFIKYKNLSNWTLLFQLSILKQGRQSGQAKWAGKVAGKVGRQMPVLFLFFSLLQCNLEYSFLHFTNIARPDTGLVCLSRKEYDQFSCV